MPDIARLGQVGRSRVRPDVRRPYEVPGGRNGAIVISVLTTFFAFMATVGLLWPGIGTSDPDAALPAGFEGARAEYELTQFLPLILFVIAGALFYRAGKATREKMVPIPAAAEADGDASGATPAR